MMQVKVLILIFCLMQYACHSNADPNRGRLFWPHQSKPANTSETLPDLSGRSFSNNGRAIGRFSNIAVSGNSNRTAYYGCGSWVTVPYQGSVTMTSPGYPSYYPSNQQCITGYISADPNAQLKITCSNFQMQMWNSMNQCYDHFSTLDGNQRVTVYCGYFGPNGYMSQTNWFIGRFISDGSTEAVGYNCVVSSVNGNTVTTDSTSATTTPTTVAPTTVAPTCTCGTPVVQITVTGRIAGGRISGIYMYPYMVALLDNTGTYVCAGALISDQHVLTSGTCSLLVTSSTSTAVLGSSSRISTNAVTRDISFIDTPSTFSSTVSPKTSDVAVLTLDSPVDLTDENIGTICRFAESVAAEALTNKEGLLVGWGSTTNAGDAQTTIREVDQTVTTVEACDIAYTTSLSNDYLCAGTADLGPCENDRGSPLTIEIDGKQVAVAIVTEAAGGCLATTTSNPALYTTIARHRTWINSIIGSATTCTA